MSTEASGRGSHARRLARSTAFFSFATGLSRLLGLAREVVAARYFGVTGAMSAFTIAFQVPNLLRALVADSALQGAFVPVFTELLEKGERKEAFRVASSLFFLICLVLGAITALFVIFAEPIMSLFAPGFDDQPALQDLTVNLARLMFPIVVLLALSGLVVGMLNSFEHFSVPALAPVAWNAVIIAALIGLVPMLPEDDEIYAYAIGILAGTVVQFLLPLPWLRGRGGHLTLRLDWRDERVRRVLALMLPVTIALGPDQPQPGDQLAVRHARLRRGARRDRQGISDLPAAPGPVQHLDRHDAVPDAGALRRPRGPRRPAPHHGERRAPDLPAADPQRGADGACWPSRSRGWSTSAACSTPRPPSSRPTALVWWSISLPFQGVSLLFSRTFFSLQRPWATTALSGVNLLVNAGLAAALYGPFGIAGIVIGTVAGTVVMCVAQGWVLRGELGGVEAGRTLAGALRMLIAAALLGGAAYGVWYGLGRGARARLPRSARGRAGRDPGRRRRLRRRGLGAARARGAPDLAPAR